MTQNGFICIGGLMPPEVQKRVDRNNEMFALARKFPETLLLALRQPDYEKALVLLVEASVSFSYLSKDGVEELAVVFDALLQRLLSDPEDPFLQTGEAHLIEDPKEIREELSKTLLVEQIRSLLSEVPGYDDCENPVRLVLEKHSFDPGASPPKWEPIDRRRYPIRFPMETTKKNLH